jgi:hypothetical protein
LGSQTSNRRQMLIGNGLKQPVTDRSLICNGVYKPDTDRFNICNGLL